MSSPKIILLGLTGFGNAALRALQSCGCTLGAVVTRTEPGEHPYYEEANLAKAAREQGIPTFEGVSLKDAALLAHIKSFQPDLIVVATYHERVSGSIIRLAAHGAIAVHPSLLPQGRGATPTTWALVEGMKETGVTLYQMTPKPFEGDILEQKTVAISSQDTDGSLRKKLADAGQELLQATIAAFAKSGALNGKKVDAANATTFPPRTRRDARISFDDSTRNIHNRVRATNPFPGAYLQHENREIRILESRIVPGTSYEVKSGLVLDRNNGFTKVKTADGQIELRLESSDASIPLGAVLGEAPVAACSAKPKANGVRNIIHTREEYGLENDAVAFPRMIVLAVAYPCNARCPNCPYTEGNSDIRKHYMDAPFIDVDLFKKIARECGEHDAYLRITGGGEPMLHPADMVSLIEYARAHGSHVWLNTNGSCFTEEKLDRLLACGLDQIEFSVDASDPETYDKVRPGLDWDGLLASVSYMVKKRNESGASTNIVVSVINQDLLTTDIDDVARFWLDLGVDEVIRRKYLTWGANTTLDRLHSADESPYLDKAGGDPCPFPFHRLNIDSRGKIEVCGYDISGRTNFGSVRDKTISEIWRGPSFEWWRNMHLQRRGGEIPLCRECPDWAYRSWNHNWQKVMKNAATHREQAVEALHIDEAGVMSTRVRK